MIAALMVLSVLWWTYWWMFRNTQSPSTPTRSTAPIKSSGRAATALGLEDDPEQWRASRGAWTALDERQLTRLLTNAAPVNRPAPNTTDHAAPHVEHEDTA